MNIETVHIDETLVAIDRDIVSDVILGAMKRKQYEHVEARVGTALMNDDSFPDEQVVLEIGAGLGFVGSCLYRTGKIKRIVSYEGNPALIPLIQETHRLNGVESDVRNAILGDQAEGVTEIFIPKDFWAASTAQNAHADRVSVPCASFSEVLENERPTFLLVDIEGGERTLFESIESLGTVKHLLIEIHQRSIGRAGIRRFFSAMCRLGMSYDQFYSTGKVLLFQRVDVPV